MTSSPEGLLGVFARHETFAPRFGWLRKGFVAVSDNPRFFLQKDAHLEIGVGKNQARAIRYWCHATGLLSEITWPKERLVGSRQTEFGTWLLGSRGRDPYLEDPASLWWLHWALVRSPVIATGWHFAFTVFTETEFTAEGLATAIGRYAASRYPAGRTVRSSFEKDASCILRMYCGPSLAIDATEEHIHSPFAELGVLDTMRLPSQRYRFNAGVKRTLPAAIVAAACLDYAAASSPAARTITLSRLLSDPGSPGMAFKLGATALADYLEEAVRGNSQLSLADSAGLVQLGFKADPTKLVRALLESYYKKAKPSAAA